MSIIKGFIHSIQYFISLIGNYFYDLKRYYLHSSFRGRVYTEGQLIARITAHYHVLEKGFSFPEMKESFGKDVVLGLIRLINLYETKRFDQNNVSVNTAKNAVLYYKKLHDELGVSLSWWPLDKVKSYNFNENFETSVKYKSAQEIIGHSKSDFKKLAENRFSIRNFSSSPVPIELIKDAVEISLKTPSVCNRQSWRVKCIERKELKDAVLSIHHGNRGFSHLIDKLLVVTTELNAFDYAKERYQCYIDGGLFSMSLMYALQYNGLGSCPLNWSVEKKADQEMRKTLDLPDSETIIMLIAVGYISESLKVPGSQRFPIQDIFKIL